MEKVIIISSKIENLRLIESFIEELCNEYRISNEKYGNILIAILEATNNAIVHGNKLNEKENVIVKAHYNNNLLKVSIKDNGKGFDYLSIPDPTAPENVEKLNGRGIFLMNKLSDKIEFKENGKSVQLFFKT